MLKSLLSGDEPEELLLQLGLLFGVVLNNRLEHLWFDSMILFQQWLRTFSMKGDVAQKSNLTSLLSASVPFGYSFLGIKNQAGASQHMLKILA